MILKPANVVQFSVAIKKPDHLVATQRDPLFMRQAQYSDNNGAQETTLKITFSLLYVESSSF